MTKTKAFFICFFVPIVYISACYIILFVLLDHGGADFQFSFLFPVMVFLFVLTPFLFFGPASMLKEKVKKYGYYGALFAGVLMWGCFNFLVY